MKIIFAILLIQTLLSCAEKDKKNNPELRFDFSFKGLDFSMHEGDQFYWRLIDRFEKKSVLEGEFKLEGTEFEVAAEQVLREKVWYDLVFYSDFNSNAKCDSPPEDHSWRVSVDAVDGNVALEDQHLMIFSDVCDEFEDSEESTKLMTISGSLNLEDAVSLESVEGGAVAQAQIFAAGFPTQETFSDTNGSFTLSLKLPLTQELVPDSLNILMWYSERDDTSKVAWPIPKKRVGAARSVEVADDIQLGTVELTYTKGIRIPVVDSVTAESLPKCWVRIDSLGAQTVGRYHIEKKTYEIAYLPSGQYEVKFLCQGYQEQSQIYEVGEATDFDQWENQGQVKMNPTN